MTSEEKRAFLEAVSAYKKFGETIYRNGDLMETYGAIKTIVENANKVTLEETGEWFDRVTVNRHMKSMNESFKVFQKTLSEVHTSSFTTLLRRSWFSLSLFRNSYVKPLTSVSSLEFLVSSGLSLQALWEISRVASWN